MELLNFSALKVGDRVGVSSRYSAMCEVKVVAKRTATQVILDDGSRWNKHGRRIGEAGYMRAWLMTEQDANERNEDERKRIERGDLVRSAREIVFGEISDDGLRMILQVAKDHKR